MHFYIKDWPLRFKSLQVSGLLLLSYGIDWAAYLLILVGAMVYGTVVPPLYHEFLLGDTSLMYTYVPEDESTIPMPLLVTISIIVPCLQFVLCSVFSRKSLSTTRGLWDIFAGLMALFGSMATQLLVVCILKNVCGLPRPDMLSRCQPAAWDETPPQLATVAICTRDNDAVLQEGFRSFPSGHLSTVFCGMIMCSLNIAGKLQVFDGRGVSFKVVLAIAPIIVATIVACTRISDNRHFLRDVIGGAVIGTSIGMWFYLQYFPSVFNLKNSGRAYPPRRIGVANFFNNIGGFWKIHDKLPGSYERRALNTTEAIKKINSLVSEHQVQLPSPTGLIDTDNNIELVNIVGELLGLPYLDVEQDILDMV